ncbi:MAG: (2Fe-2S)-binding protein [Armatimonadetes bacterium]|nr:(2Fe-2S)-binding protein [Armatimonadota bacterium]
MKKDNTRRRGGEFQEIAFTINGRKVKTRVPPSMLLLDLIRDELSLKGTKPGCLEGECGACSVLIDGSAVNSCLYLAVNTHGKEVTTIEGLSGDGPDPVLESLIRNGAIQCGFCSPGMAIAIKSLQNRFSSHPTLPDREMIKKGLEGNLCRCTGYVKILDAAEEVLKPG